MEGIERAQVHLAIKETQAFRRSSDTPAEASVVVKLRNRQRPDMDVVRGISQLVASSIDTSMRGAWRCWTMAVACCRGCWTRTTRRR